jgi:hypothetical protein
MSNAMSDEHIYRHEDETPRISMKVERNSRGYNWECGVSNCIDADAAIALLKAAEAKLKMQWDTVPPARS